MKWGKTIFENIYKGHFDENGQFTGKGTILYYQATYTDP